LNISWSFVHLIVIAEISTNPCSNATAYSRANASTYAASDSSTEATSSVA
jgi:hypothetical protein